MSKGFSNTKYAERAHRLLQIANNLRQIGAHTVVDIPRICVIGSQSAGKSSLVEAVSGIRVPRDSGTCTRCPLEMLMTNNPAPWKCQISLRFDYNDHHESIESRKISFGPPLTDRSDIELMLRRAQAAILNPDVTPENFLTKNERDLAYYRTDEALGRGTLKFSRNAICVDVHDPDLPDISFIDLPGLIQNDIPETVNLVEDLVKENLHGEKCLILVTIPMSDDMENQRAMRLAKEADPDQIRTVVVLTKPDTLTSGATNSRQRWKEIVDGNSHKLKHGYYCVKLADDEERAEYLDRAEAERRASAFFQTSPFWTSISDRGKVGVLALVGDLSHHLTVILDRELPKLRIEVDLKLEECRLKLQELPKPPDAEATEIIKMVTNFCSELQAMVYGKSSNKLFIQENRETYKGFKNAIRGTVPKFKPFEHGIEYRCVGSDDEDDKPVFYPGMQRVGPTFDLLEVRRVIKSATTWELPHNVPFDATIALIGNFLCLWDAPVQTCYQAVCRDLHDQLGVMVQTKFERFPALFTQIFTHVMGVFTAVQEKALIDVMKVVELEKLPLFTQNLHYLDSVRNRWHTRYKDARRNSANFRLAGPSVATLKWAPPPVPRRRSSICESEYRSVQEAEPYNATVDRALQALKKLGYGDISKMDLARLTPTDSFEEELMVMANVRAYFQVAYKRIIDYVPMTIEQSLTQALVNHIQQPLIKHLDITGPNSKETACKLLAENPAIVEKRGSLVDRLKKLEAAQKELMFSFETFPKENLPLQGPPTGLPEPVVTPASTHSFEIPSHVVSDSDEPDAQDTFLLGMALSPPVTSPPAMCAYVD